jgi:cytoskeleton protein RodZ
MPGRPADPASPSRRFVISLRQRTGALQVPSVSLPVMDNRQHICEALRTAREALGLSLEQAAADAGVPVHYARLLEGAARTAAGVADELYLVPFFRRYSTFVGADTARLLPEFLGIVQQVPIPAATPLRAPFRPLAGVLWKPAAVLAAVMTAVLLILQQAPERARIDDDEAESDVLNGAPSHDGATGDGALNHDGLAAASDPHADRPSAAGDALALGTRASGAPVGSDPDAGSSSTGEQPATTSAGRELRIEADEETWLSIGIDEQPKKSLLLRPGDAQTWTANSTFTLTLGNAGGVRVSVDGTELPRLGRSGEVVRNLRLPKYSASPAGG